MFNDIVYKLISLVKRECFLVKCSYSTIDSMTIARSLLTPIPTEREIETLKGIFSTMQKLFVLSSNPDKGAFEITKGERTFNELPATFAKYHEAKKQSVQRGRGGGEGGRRGKI